VPGHSSIGDDGDRTHDPELAKLVLSQLSYVPVAVKPVRFNIVSTACPHRKLPRNRLTYKIVKVRVDTP